MTEIFIKSDPNLTTKTDSEVTIKTNPEIILQADPDVKIATKNEVTKAGLQNIIKLGDYVIIQRQAYTKLHKIKQNGTIQLGQMTVELEAIVGRKYEDIFQMKAKYGHKKCYELEQVDRVSNVTIVKAESSGADNRNIEDANNSQMLTAEDIDKLRDNSQSANEIVEKLVSNSTTFANKTEYSQEKYLKKKEKKYFDYIKVRKPTIRLLATMFYRQDTVKIQGLRIDDLSRLLTYSNIQSTGNFLLYDSGTCGLLTAALTNAIGSGTSGKLVHVHPGNECQKNAFNAMQFPADLQERVVNVNSYSVIRWYYQKKESFVSTDNGIDDEIIDGGTEGHGIKRRLKMSQDAPAHKRPCWQYDNEKACRIFDEKLSSVIIASKEHPQSIVKEFIPFLKNSGILVVYHTLIEPLQDLYQFLKSTHEFINIQLSSSFMRDYQVLDSRTHPMVNMTYAKYILYAQKINNNGI